MAAAWIVAGEAWGASTSIRSSRKKDRARVLHTTRSELRHGDEVELVEGVGTAEVLGEARQQRRRGVEREARQRQLGGGRDHAQRHPVDGGVELGEVANRERDQVRR